MPADIALSRLDASMARCGVTFVCGYRFHGAIDAERLHQSIAGVLSQVSRLARSICSDARGRGHWQAAPAASEYFWTMMVSDLDAGYRQVFRDVFALKSQRRCAPMFFILMRTALSPDEFMILQCGDHSHCDGGSVALLFNQVIRYYNALCAGDSPVIEGIQASLRRLTSPAPDAIYAFGRGKTLIRLGHVRHLANLCRLAAYRTTDAGQYATPYPAMAGQLARHSPQMAQCASVSFDLSRLMRQCQGQDPDLTPNSLVCALIAKALYELNHGSRKIAHTDTISLRILMDILPPALRQCCIGNYIAYLPVTVAGGQALHQIGRQIQNLLLAWQAMGAHLSLYKMLEFALARGLAGGFNDTTSCTLSNFSNYQLDRHPNCLAGAQCRDYVASANSNPKDLIGARLNNRPVLSFRLSPAHRLQLGFFHTLGDPGLNRQVADQIDRIIQR